MYDKSETLAEFCQMLGANVNPMKITSPYFKKVYSASAQLAKAGMTPTDPCCIVTTTTEDEAYFSNNKPGLPAVRQAEAWICVRLIAQGGFRLATAEEEQRYKDETRSHELECRTIEENRPERAQLAVQREEAKNTRDLLRTLVTAAVDKQQVQHEQASAAPSAVIDHELLAAQDSARRNAGRAAPR